MIIRDSNASDCVFYQVLQVCANAQQSSAWQLAFDDKTWLRSTGAVCLQLITLPCLWATAMLFIFCRALGLSGCADHTSLLLLAAIAAAHCFALQVLLKSPILLENQLEAIAKDSTLSSKTFDTSFKAGLQGSLAAALQKLCTDVEAAVKAGCQCVVLSDRAAEANMKPDVVPISSLLATGAVHHHLIRTGGWTPLQQNNSSKQQAQLFQQRLQIYGRHKQQQV